MAKTALQSNTIRGNLLILAGAAAGMYFGVIPAAAATTAASAALFNIYQRFNTHGPIVSTQEKEKERLKEAIKELQTEE